MTLPIYKRYIFHHRIGVNANWRVRRKCWMLTVAGVVALVCYVTDGWLNETLRRLDAEHALLGNQGWMMKSLNWGAPGWVITDWKEGTVAVEVKKIKH